MEFSQSQKEEYCIKFVSECKNWIGNELGSKCDNPLILQFPNGINIFLGTSRLTEEELNLLEERVLFQFHFRNRVQSTVSTVECRGTIRFQSRTIQDYYGVIQQLL